MTPPSEFEIRSTREPSGGGDRAPCAACRELYPHSALDQQLWCPECREELEGAARLGKHLGGLLITVPFAAWIALEGNFGVLPLYAWLFPLAAAYYLGYRIGREVARGWVRWRTSTDG